MFEEIKEKLLEYCEYPSNQLNENTEIIKDLQIDSLNVMIMIGDFEEKYDVTIDPEEIKDVVTVGDLVKILESKVNK